MMFIYNLLIGFLPLLNHNSTVSEHGFTEKIDSVYSWLTNMQQSNGLLVSSEGGRNVSLYDNALAALAYTAYGDFSKAENVFDFFDSRIESEFLTGPGGFCQMRDKDGSTADRNMRRWMGDNAWLLIAINNYHHSAKNNKYKRLASVLSNWIVSLQDTDGGIWGGFEANGKRISKIAEGNIDAFNAIEGYTIFHQKLLAHLRDVRWDKTDKMIIAWADYPKYKYALDLCSWGYCIFPDFPKSVLKKADRFLTKQKSTTAKITINGYCFDVDRDAVWYEGTGQMVIAFQKANKQRKAQKYLLEMRKSLMKSSSFENSYGLPYTSNFGTSYSDDPLWNGVDTNLAVSGTVWYLFAILQFDPLKLGYEKNIPEKEKFWIE